MPESSIYATFHQYASASLVTSYSQSANGLDLQFNVAASATPVGSASASFSFTDTYTTAGPVRLGSITGLFQPSIGNYGGFWQFGLSYPGQLYPNPGPGAGVMPFILGQPFTVTAYVTLQNRSNDFAPSFVRVGGPLVLNFFEADGITPVALTEVPEPDCSALLSVGLIGLPLVLRMRRRQTPV